MHPRTRTKRRCAETWLLVAALMAVGCGKTSATSADAGDGAVTNADGPSARRAFDVVAVLQSEAGAASLPSTNAFTFVVDAAAKLAIAGANGLGAVVPLSTSDGKAFHSDSAFAVGSIGTVCAGPQNVRYEQFDLTLSERGLAGHASGIANISCGDCSFTLPFDATLTGITDATAPSLTSATVPTTPFDAFSLATSEPLPTTASARLVADDGAAIDLVPVVVAADTIPLVVGFSKPDVVLRAGHGYGVDLGGLVDFAGHTQGSGPLIRLGSFPAAPNVAQDGFESATGATLGGAMVVTGAPLPAIAGTTSVYIGGPGAPALDTTTARSLSVRLSRQAGATTLRLSYRVVGPQSQSFFAGVLHVGSEGASPGSPTYLSLSPPVAAVDSVTVAGQVVYLGVITTLSVPLPDDAGDEVLLVIKPSDFTCGPTVPIASGLLIDDLRLE